MATIDQFEKGGRLLLWVVMAATVALVPLGAFNLAKNSARTAEQVRLDAAAQAAKDKAERVAKEAANKPQRLAIDSVGEVLHLLDGSIGTIWFSNATPREGVVCVEGTASAGEKSTTSLATCKAVEPYETNVKMSVMFAGASISKLCPGGSCAFSVKDVAPQMVPQPAVAAK